MWEFDRRCVPQRSQTPWVLCFTGEAGRRDPQCAGQKPAPLFPSRRSPGPSISVSPTESVSGWGDFQVQTPSWENRLRDSVAGLHLVVAVPVWTLWDVQSGVQVLRLFVRFLVFLTGLASSLHFSLCATVENLPSFCIKNSYWLVSESYTGERNRGDLGPLVQFGSMKMGVPRTCRLGREYENQ